jgi:hypothetical protein
LAEWRLSDAYALGGMAEVKLFGYRNEVAKKAEIDLVHI